VIGRWCDYLSGARFRLFAYGPADVTPSKKNHNLFPDLNPNWFYHSDTGVPRLKGHYTGVVVVVVVVLLIGICTSLRCSWRQ